MINKKSLLFAALLGLPMLASADNVEPMNLLKRTDVKSYEGFIQVTPKESPKINLTLNFIKPTYDYRPISSGAMVGLIQRSGNFKGMSIKFDEKCTGEMKLKIGVKEFNSDNYGYITTDWQFSSYAKKVIFNGGTYKGKDSPAIETIGDSAIKSVTTRGTNIIIDFPESIPYFPGDVLVIEEASYMTTEDRVFNQCAVEVKER